MIAQPINPHFPVVGSGESLTHGTRGVRELMKAHSSKQWTGSLSLFGMTSQSCPPGVLQGHLPARPGYELTKGQTRGPTLRPRSHRPELTLRQSWKGL